MGAVWEVIGEIALENGIVEGEIFHYAVTKNRPHEPIDEGNNGIDILHTIGKYGWETLRWLGESRWSPVRALGEGASHVYG